MSVVNASNKANITPMNVYVVDEVWQKQERLVQVVPAEVAWFGLCTVVENKGVIIVDDIVVPEQKVTTTEVDYSEAYLHDVMEQIDDEDIPRLRFFGHSHHDAAVHLSPTDMNEFIYPLMDVGMDYFVTHVQNKKGDQLTRLDLKKPFELCMEVQLKRTIPTHIDEWAKEQYEEKVTVKETKKPGTWAGGSYNTGSYNKGVNKKRYPEWSEEEVKKAPITIVKDRDQGDYFPRAVIHHLKTRKRTYYENGKWIGTTDMTLEMAMADWRNHEEGTKLREKMLEDKGFALQEEDREAKKKETREALRSAEGKVQAPAKGASSSQTQTVSDPKSGEQGQKQGKQPRKEQKLLTATAESLSPSSAPTFEITDIEEEIDIENQEALALMGESWFDPDTFEDVTPSDTDDKEVLDALSEDDLAALANMAAVSGLSDLDLRSWGLLRDPTTGEIVSLI